VDEVNFSLICAVICRAIKDFLDSEEGNVLELRFWLCCVGEDMLGFELFSWEISGSNTIKNIKLICTELTLLLDLFLYACIMHIYIHWLFTGYRSPL
jgi:hypothetical protein